MKKLSLVFALLLMCMCATAQITWNVKAGVGIATFAGDSGDGNSKMKLGWKVGVGIEKPLSANWLIMPSLEFKQKGSAWEGQETYYDYEEHYYSYEDVVTLNYLQLPILGAYRTRLNDDFNLTLKAGPYLAYALSGDYEWSDNEGDNGSADIFGKEMELEGLESSRFDFGLALGADVEYHRFVVGAEAEFGFIPCFKNTEDNISIRNISAYITVGYKF